VTIAALAGRSTPDSLGSFFSIMPMAMVIGYVLGLVPALVTSLVVALVARRVASAANQLVATTLIGAGTSLLALFWIVVGPIGGDDRRALFGAFAITGAVAALVSMLTVFAMTPRERTA
jgi:O-antigen ligase